MGHEFASQGPLWGISAGTTKATSGTVVFSNSNGVSFGMNASTVTASVSSLVLSNSNGVSFGTNGSTVTASINGIPTVSILDNGAFPFGTGAVGGLNNNSMVLFPWVIPVNISATRLDIFASQGGAATFTCNVHVYTLSGSTASRASSASAQVTLPIGQGAGSIALGTFNFTPGQYLIGLGGSSNGIQNLNYYGATLLGSFAINMSSAPAWGDAILSASTMGSIHMSQMTGTDSVRPLVRIMGTI